MSYAYIIAKSCGEEEEEGGGEEEEGGGEEPGGEEEGKASIHVSSLITLAASPLHEFNALNIVTWLRQVYSLWFSQQYTCEVRDKRWRKTREQWLYSNDVEAIEQLNSRFRTSANCTLLAKILPTKDN